MCDTADRRGHVEPRYNIITRASAIASGWKGITLTPGRLSTGWITLSTSAPTERGAGELRLDMIARNLVVHGRRETASLLGIRT